jgi:hypothetical protein
MSAAELAKQTMFAKRTAEQLRTEAEVMKLGHLRVLILTAATRLDRCAAIIEQLQERLDAASEDR